MQVILSYTLCNNELNYVIGLHVLFNAFVSAICKWQIGSELKPEKRQLQHLHKIKAHTEWTQREKKNGTKFIRFAVVFITIRIINVFMKCNAIYCQIYLTC